MTTSAATNDEHSVKISVSVQKQHGYICIFGIMVDLVFIKYGKYRNILATILPKSGYRAMQDHVLNVNSILCFIECSRKVTLRNGRPQVH